MKNPDFTESSGTVSLTRYDAARSALAEARSVDEVKDIRDKAVAMREYAKQAKDAELIGWATEIKLRAEMRAGEMLAEMRENGERRQSRDPCNTALPALPDLGVSRMQSSRWQQLSAMSPEARELRISAAKKEAVSHIEMPFAARAAEKKQMRAEREEALAAKITALPQKRYGVILADPPWRFKTYSEIGLTNGSADNHYPTLSLEQIKAHDVPSISAVDSVLFLWATVPHLANAIDIMRWSWGFDYKSNIAWLKDRSGNGYWLRNKHEHLLIGTRGDVPAPAPGTQFDSAFEAPVRSHPQKPDVVYRMIEAYFPNLPKCELFARAARPGWSCWGNEAPVTLEMERAS